MGWLATASKISTEMRARSIYMTGTGVTAGSAVFALIVGVIASGIGGAGGGLLVGGKAIGNQLAAMLGSFYGPVGALPGLAVGLIALALLW
jgi:hypothetical protein